MKYLTTPQLLALSGLRNRRTIYDQIRKGNLKGQQRDRRDGGLVEWVFEETEAQRFAEWVKVTPIWQR